MSTLVDEDFTIVVSSTKSSQSITQIPFWWELRDWSHRLTSSIVRDRVGGNPESPESFQTNVVSNPVLDMFHKTDGFETDFKNDHTEWPKAAFATELGETRKARYVFRHISCPTWSTTKPNDYCAQDHCCCDKSWGKPGKHAMLSDACQVRPCHWWAKQVINPYSEQPQFSMCSLVV